MLIVFWKLPSGVVLNRVFGPPKLVEFAEARDKDGKMENHIVCEQTVPYGVVAWRESPSDPWRPMSEWRTP